MFQKTKRKLMIALTMAVISIVVFILIGVSGSIYYANTRDDQKDLDKFVLSYQDGKPDFAPPSPDKNNEFKKNEMKDLPRRAFFYVEENNGIISDTTSNMPFDFKNSNKNDLPENMLLYKPETISNVFEIAKNSGDSGTVKYDDMYFLFRKISEGNINKYYFIDTTMTHAFFKNAVNIGILILLLTLIYISIIGRKILDKALKPLELSIENQKRFTGDASHELRTPLTAMRSNLDVLIDYDLTKEEEQIWLTNISNEIDRMTRLTNDLLMLSRNDTIEKEYQEFYMNDVLDRLYNNYKNLCNIEIEGGDFSVIGVKEEILQLLMIFVDNGIKYNDKEEKNIYVEAIKTDKSFIITIKDNGNGIEEDKYDEIFERFFREDKARTGSQKGFGLGLSIAKNIIDDYNGKIKVKSTIGEGTTFSIMFNLKK